MKISQKEIDTAWQHAFHSWPGSSKGQVRMMLEAAYTVRRARKKAKRERQRKEKDKQVQESAWPVGVLLGIDPFWVNPAPVGDEHIISSKFPPSKAPDSKA